MVFGFAGAKAYGKLLTLDVHVKLCVPLRLVVSRYILATISS